jgi:putative lipoprotein
MKRAAQWAPALVLLCIVLAPGRVRAQDDPWLGRDKGLHFAAGAVLALGGWAVGIPLFDERPPRFVLGATLGVTATIAKELYDWAGHGNPSWRDFTWGLLGTGVGLLVAWVLDVLLVRDRTASPPAEPSGATPGALLFRFGGT